MMINKYAFALAVQGLIFAVGLSQDSEGFGSVDEVARWTEEALKKPWDDSCLPALVEANERLNLDPESSRRILQENVYLFHALGDPVYQCSDLRREDCERLVWTMAIEREKFRRATPEETTDKAEFSRVLNVEPYQALHLILKASKNDAISKNLISSLLILMVVLMACIQYFRMRKRREISNSQSPEFQRFIQSFLSDSDPEHAIMDLSLLSFQHGQHPLVLGLAENDAWHCLTDREKMIAALVYDDIPTQKIIEETRKNAGTIYNLRSTIRRKLGLADGADLRQGLKQLVKGIR